MTTPFVRPTALVLPTAWVKPTAFVLPTSVLAGGAQSWTFPGTDLGVKVEVAWSADPNADPSEWFFFDMSDRLVRNQPITIRRGRGDGQPSLQSSSCSFLLDNTDAELTPTRRASSLWPYVRRQTPVRISVTNVGPNPPYTRSCGFISAIIPKIITGSGGENLSVVQIQVAGVMRRLSQGTATKSPLVRTILARNATTPDYYWPMQEGIDADSFGALLGGVSIPITDPDHVVLAADSRILGSSALPSIETYDGGRGVLGVTGMQGTFVSLAGFAATGYSFSCVFAAEPGDGATHIQLLAFDQSGASGLDAITVNIYASTTGGVLDDNFGIAVTAVNTGTGVGFAGYDSTTASPLTAPNPFDGRVHTVAGTVVQSGGDVAITAVIDGTTYTGTASTKTLGTPVNVNLPHTRYNVTFGGGDTGDNRGAVVVFGHLAVWTGTSPTDPYQAARGYVGERAHLRAARVLAEEGIPSAVRGEGVRMGPQPIATVPDILRDGESTDRGILFEPRDGFGVGYIAHTARYNPTPVMTIDLATYRVTEGDQGQVLVPIYDDQRLRNQWTIGRPGGKSKTVHDDDSIAVEGTFDDQAEANVEDDNQPEQIASWRVWELVQDELRYPAPPVDAGANTATLLERWLTVDLGDLVVRTGAPDEHTGEDINEILMGYGETLLPRSWRAVTSMSSATPWLRVHVVESVDGNLGRVGSKSSSLSSDATSVATSISVAVGGVLWRTGATSFPIEVGPEVMTVTNISGGSSPQTFTVTRSVNGIVNAPGAGTVVRLWRPGRYGL